PAWLQRDQVQSPLSVGTQLNNDDKIITGGNARVLLQAADGSAIKLGQNANLRVSNLAQQYEDKPLFTALLDVAKGAFRFTTAALSKPKPRAVTINVANTTIGIRGTDVWGKDGDDKGIVCLIEGKIAVQGADKTQFEMAQPLSFYEMPKGAAAKAVAAVDPAQLTLWAAETEIAPDAAAAKLGGQWKVSLLTAADQASALTAYDAWRAAGYAVRLMPVAKDGNTAYQVRVEQFASKAAAQQFAKEVTGKLGADSPSVIR
ncbi:MAG: FecR domain-containing protein, partial [Gallionella sp.]